MTRLGVIARAENRGLGHLTWETFRHVPGARALVVDPGNFTQGFEQFPNRYDATGLSLIVRWQDDQTLDETTCRTWLQQLDVVYIAETAYDRRMYRWAADAGVATVLHTMPELHHVDEAHMADVVWCPTPWRMNEVFDRTTRPVRLVPFPVALDRFDRYYGKPFKQPGPDGPVNVLHVAGHAAYMDRNGTKLAAAASTAFDHRVRLGVASQDEHVALGNGTRLQPTIHYWTLYAGADVLLMPRRFGGLCLPIQEASAAGLAIIALDTEPHDWYGCADVEAEVVADFETGSGIVEVHTARPDHIADAVNMLAFGTSGGERLLEARRARSRAWAEAHSWDALLPTWDRELRIAIDVARDRAR